MFYELTVLTEQKMLTGGPAPSSLARSGRGLTGGQRSFSPSLWLGEPRWPGLACSLSGCERHVCGWEAWLPHVCVWVHSPLHQHPPGPQWPAQKGHSLWRDPDRGKEGVPGPPSGAGRVQRILLAGAGRTDGEWFGGQLARGGTVLWFVRVAADGGLLAGRWTREASAASHPSSRADDQVTHMLGLWLSRFLFDAFQVSEAWIWTSPAARSLS